MFANKWAGKDPFSGIPFPDGARTVFRIAALCTALAVSMPVVPPCGGGMLEARAEEAAASGRAAAEAAPYDLADDTVEFDEIPSLVEHYSLLAKMEEDLIEANTSYLDENRDNLKAYYQDIIDSLDDAISELEDEKDAAEDKSVRTALNAQIRVMKRVRNSKHSLKGLSGELQEINAAIVALKNMDDTIDTAKKSTVSAIKSQLYNGKKLLGNGMQTLVFSYKNLELTEKLLEQQIAMYEASYEKAERQELAGQATALDVQQARLNLEGAENNLEATQNGLLTMKRAIGTSLGWSVANYQNIVFGELPSYSLDYMDGRVLETDIQSALQQNSEYGTARSTVEKNITGWTSREISLETTEQEIRVAVEALQKEVWQKREEYEAAGTSADIARLKKERADRMDSAGLIGRSDYEGLQLDYLNKENAVEMAKMAYDQAVFNYEQAVYKGIMTLGS